MCQMNVMSGRTTRTTGLGVAGCLSELQAPTESVSVYVGNCTAMANASLDRLAESAARFKALDRGVTPSAGQDESEL